MKQRISKFKPSWGGAARPLVPVNQGIANAGKFLKVDAQGNVTVEAVDIPSVDGLVTTEQLEQAVANLVSSTDLQEAIDAVEAQIPSVEGLATTEQLAEAVNGLASEEYVDNAVDDKQDTLESGVNIKTINGQPILGSGNIEVEGGSGVEGLDIEQDELDPDRDLVFQDAEGNVLVEFSNGHIKTKNFDSANIETSGLSLPFQSFKGLTVGFLGDSITAGSSASTSANRYTSKFCEIAECTEKNLGIGGTCLANNTKNGASANRFLTRVTSANMSNLDFLFISGGTNDFSYDAKAVGDHFAEETREGNTYIGTKVRVANPDNETFSGALHELILAIRELKPNMPIVYINMLTRNEYGSPARPSSRECNANGNYLSDFNDAIADICAFYSIPVFDVRNHFPNDFYSSTTYCASDHLHPNDKGHLALAQALYRWAITNLSF